MDNKHNKAKKNTDFEYLPKVRTDYAPTKGDLESHGHVTGDYVITPDPTKDDIACNNIATSEFDYTEEPEE